MTENSDEEISSEVSEKFLSLPIDPKLLSDMGEYSNFLRSSLQKSSEVNVHHVVLNLRNQVLQYLIYRAEVLNTDLILSLNSLKCKHSLLKEKFKLKSHANKQQIQRISLLEDTINYLHTSYTKIIKHSRLLEQEFWQFELNPAKFIRPMSRRGTVLSVQSLLENKTLLTSGSLKVKNDEKHGMWNVFEAEALVYVHRNFSKEMKIGIDIARNEVKAYKEVLSKVTDQLKVSHDMHQRNIKAVMMEYRRNCQEELQRRQGEITTLHEVMAHWMNQCMELQDKIGIPSSGVKSMHRRSLSKKYSDMIKVLCEKTKEVTKVEVRKHAPNIASLGGDQSPPLFCE